MFGIKNSINAYFIDTYPDPNDIKEMNAVNKELLRMKKEVKDFSYTWCH